MFSTACVKLPIFPSCLQRARSQTPPCLSRNSPPAKTFLTATANTPSSSCPTSKLSVNGIKRTAVQKHPRASLVRSANCAMTVGCWARRKKCSRPTRTPTTISNRCVRPSGRAPLVAVRPPRILGCCLSGFVLDTGSASPRTLFTSPLAKTAFFAIITVGEALRSQHATWSVRLQSVVATLSTTSPRHVNVGSGKNNKENAPPPIHVDPTIIGSEVNPKLSALVPGFAPTSNTSMFLVFRRCLASDCDCDASGSHATLQVLAPPLGSKKTAKSKATRSLATNPPDRPKKASDTLPQPSPDAQAGPAIRVFDTPSLQGVMPGGHEPPGPAWDAALPMQETETFSPSPKCKESIVDPRIFRFRAELMRSNVARRALMDWCRAWATELRLDPQEKHRTGATNKSITRGTHECSSAKSLDPEKVKLQRSRRTTGKVEEATTKEPFRSDETTAQEIQFDSQEELKERWLTAQRKHRRRVQFSYEGLQVKVEVIVALK